MIVEARGYAPKYLLTSVLEDDPNRIELTRGLVASGIIVDENGQSVSDAVLTPVYGGNRHWKGRVRPGTDGSFQLQDLDQDTIVELNVPGSQRTQRLTDLAGKTNQQVVLESFIPATGRVTASDTGNPIRQFRIRIGNPAPATPALQKPAVLPRGSWDQGYIIDSEDGTFELGEFRRGDVVSLIISADGYATCEIDPYLVAKESVPIELSRATDSMRTWRGSVRAEDGSPVPDARLTLVVHRKGESEIPHRVGDEYFVRRMRMHNVVLEGSSSADGSFDLGSMILPHGGTLVAESDHHIGELLRLDDDSPDPVEITLRTGTRLRIQYDRTLFRNAEYVEFRRTDGSASFEMPLPPEVDRFDIGSLEPGEYIVTLMTMGDRRGTRTRILRPSSRSVKLARGQQALVTFTETDGFIVEGRVMDGESAWTEGAILYLQRRQPRFDDSPHLLDMYLATHETLVSADGSFSFTNVDAGTYQFRLHGIDGDFTDQGIGGGDPFEVTASMSGLIVQRH
jgi:hypothetical protein